METRRNDGGAVARRNETVDREGKGGGGGGQR